MTKPALLVARAIFPDTLHALQQVFDVDYNASDEVFTPAQLLQRLQGKQAAFTTGSERIDADIVAAYATPGVTATVMSAPAATWVSRIRR